jgi:hypothetical protein
VKDKIKECTKPWTDLKKQVTKVKNEILVKKDALCQKLYDKFLNRATKFEEKYERIMKNSQKGRVSEIQKNGSEKEVEKYKQKVLEFGKQIYTDRQKTKKELDKEANLSKKPKKSSIDESYL